MTLTTFLFAAQGLMELEGLSFHVETDERPLPSPADVREQNRQSMAMLAGIMKGVQGAPGVKR